MEKKSVSATILVLFLSLLFAVIGVCFNQFVYDETLTTIEKVAIAKTGVKVYGDSDLQTEIDALSLSSMDLGLKPATGEVDEETQIPSTITDEGTSEGYYAKVYVPAGTAFKVTVTNITLDTKSNEIEAQEERKNIYVAIKDIQNATKSLEEDEVELAKFENVEETLELTFLIWLGSLASEELVATKIYFTLNFIAI